MNQLVKDLVFAKYVQGLILSVLLVVPVHTEGPHLCISFHCNYLFHHPEDGGLDDSLVELLVEGDFTDTVVVTLSLRKVN